MLSSKAVVGEPPIGEDGNDGANQQLASASASAASGLGTEFGDYFLEKEIAHGGMGVVYRARQMSLDRTVAIKLLLLGRYSSAESIERFRREAQAIGALRHSGIVTVHEVGEHEGQHYIAMEYVDGPTLSELLRGGPLTPQRAAEIVRDVARAVHYAHERGVLHRDIKPSNVLLDSSGRARITDFGLAKKLDGSTDLTVTGQMVGTPNYLSPEQAAGRNAEIGPASDIYAIGALLYELLTGRPPFMANSLQETLLRIRDAEPISPRAQNPAVDREIETICLKCLEKEPQRRYVSADALAQELERWLRREPIQARPCSTWMRVRKWTLRQPRLAALLLISIVAIVAFVVGQTIMTLRLNKANTRLSTSLSELRWRAVDDADRAGNVDEAIAWLSFFLRQNPNDSTAVARLLSLLSSHNFPVLLHPPLPHEAAVLAIDFSRDGERLASASGATARVWNVQTGQLEVDAAHPAPVTNAILVGESDLRLLTLSAEPKARLWDVSKPSLHPVSATNAGPRIIKEIGLGRVDERLVGRKLLPTRDRRLIAMTVQSNVVGVLNAEAGTWVSPPLILSDEIYRIAFSEDGRLLATATQSGIQLWDVPSSRALFPSRPWNGWPADLRFSEDGRRLACSSGGKMWVVNTATGDCEPEFDSSDLTIAFVDNSETLVTGGQNPKEFNFRTGRDCGSAFGGQLRVDWLRHASLSALLFSSKNSDRRSLLDPSTGFPRMEPFFHGGWILDAKLHPNGKLGATASQDRTVRIWSVEMGGIEPTTLQVGGEVHEARWSPSGEKILSATIRDKDAELRLWDGRSGSALTLPLSSGDVVYSAAWAPDGKSFATASQDFTARIWSGDTGEAVSPALRHDDVVTHCNFSSDGKLLATAGDDRVVRLWDGHTGAAIGARLAHSHAPLHTDFSKDSRRLVTAAQDGTVRVWAVPDGKLLLGPLHHDGTCWSAYFSPDDRLIVSASSDGTARLWDATTGQPKLPPFRHEGPVFSACFSPDGRAIATSTESGIARVWDTLTGKPLSEPMRHPSKVWLAKWSPDGHFLATSCTDGSARIWEPFTGHLMCEPFTHQPGKEVRRVAFSPDGGRLLTASYDGTIKIWDLAFLRPPIPAPDWLPDLAETLGGKRIGAKDAPESVPGDGLQRVRHRLAQSPGNDYYSHWARWMLEERLQRPVKPF
jgi:WD40 repeat protein/serine/threonine protein kinase